MVRQALSIQILGPEHPTTGDLLHTLGLQYAKLGHYAQSIPFYQRALRIREKEAQQSPRKLFLTLTRLAEANRILGQPAVAEPLARRALAWGETRFGKDHIDVALSLAILAEVYVDMQQLEMAQPHAVRALRIREAQQNADALLVADSLDQVQQIYRSSGKYAKALPLALRALDLRQARLGDNHQGVANSLHGLALLYEFMGRYGEAEPLLKQAIHIWEAALGNDHPDVAVGLANLALVYRQSGQFALAEPLYRRALTIREAKLGKDHPSVAMTLDDLSVTYRGLGQSALAEPLALRVLAIREARFGKDDPSVASALVNLAALRQDLDRSHEAEADLRRALAIYERKQGKESVLLGAPLQNLCDIYRRQGRYKEALPLCTRSLKLWESRWGEDHPYVAINLTTLGLIQAALGQPSQSVALFDQARRRTRRHIARILPALSEREQLTFLENLHDNYFHIALSAVRHDAADPATAEISASWVLNAKALSSEILAERALLARDNGNPTAAAASQQLLEVRRQLAALSVSGPEPGREAQHTQALTALSAEERELALSVARSRGDRELKDPWIELKAVRAALPSGSVLIELARFRDFEQHAWQAPRYAAWIIPAVDQGAVRLVDLGEAAPIEAAVKVARRSLQDAPDTIARTGEREAERELRSFLQSIAQRVLEPLMPHIAGVERWIISPDADLWLVPWAALPVADGFAIEKYKISYVVSGRDLPRTDSHTSAGHPMIMADPDYDLDIPAARAETQRLTGVQSRKDVRGSSTQSPLPPKVPRLPGTAEEAKAIRPQLERYSNKAALVYLEKQALEGVFKGARGPQVFVLSTHGYFLEDQNVPPIAGGISAVVAGISASQLPSTTFDQPVENPLLRAGLVLAGANNRDQASLPTDEDGILTGLEIVGADLRGTQLVVLSACETGLGQVRNGEGVSGLRQAFQLAGAKSVVATLWQIPDHETALLMAEFFTRMADGDSVADALAKAQLLQIGQRRQLHGAAHPYYWAAFTLTGNS